MYDEIRSFTSSRLGKSHLYVRRIGHVAPLLKRAGRYVVAADVVEGTVYTSVEEDTLAAGEGVLWMLGLAAGDDALRAEAGETELIAEIDHLTNRNLFLNMLRRRWEGHRDQPPDQGRCGGNVSGAGRIEIQATERKYPASLRAAAEAGILRLCQWIRTRTSRWSIAGTDRGLHSTASVGLCRTTAGTGAQCRWQTAALGRQKVTRCSADSGAAGRALRLGGPVAGMPMPSGSR